MVSPDSFSTTAILTLSSRGLIIARKLAAELEASVFVHQDVESSVNEKKFERIAELTSQIFSAYKSLIFIAPTGVALRAVAACIRHKLTDPAVVVVDAGARWAISLLSGHEGGANDLSVRICNILGCLPVITTATQAARNIIAGVGCRKAVTAENIIRALHSALDKAGVSISQVRLLTSVDIKKKEAGLIEAAGKLGLPLLFIPSSRIRNMPLNISRSQLVQEKIGLPGVAEPCALLGGHNTKLILEKTICRQVAIALARENFLPWE